MEMDSKKTSKPKIVISGYYGFNNAGDEAILLAMLSSMRGLLPQADFTIISGNPVSTAMTHEVESIHRFRFWKILSKLKDCDVFVSGGGSLLQDVTSKRSLLYYLALIFLAKVLNRPVMLYAQGVGPISSPFMRWLTGKVLARVEFVTVRDRESLDFLIALGLSPKHIMVTADAVFMLPEATLEDGRILLGRSGLTADADVVGVAVRSWNNDKYLGALADALDVLADQGKRICIVPFQYPADVAVSKKLQRALRHPARILDRVCSTEELLSVIGNFSLLIGMRLHSLIFASVMKVPFVALEYDPKVESFVKKLDACSAGRIEKTTTEKILQAVQRAHNYEIDLSELQTAAVENNKLLGAVLGLRDEVLEFKAENEEGDC